MKIQKLYELGQFVDLMDETKPSELCEMFNLEKFEGLDEYYYSYEAISKYNDFLKKPLKKEMFVNPCEMPNKIDYDFNNKNVCYDSKGYPERCYDYDLKQWQQAESKIIFKNVEVVDDNIVLVGGKAFYFFEDGKVSVNTHMVKTLGDVARITKGELELKNVEL